MLQFLKDYGQLIELLSVCIIPFAVYFTGVSLQKRKEKQDAKMHLFLTLIETRRMEPPPVEYMKALNSIDVVFQDSEKVRQKWKDFYYSLQLNSDHYNNQVHFQLDLFATIAKELGYNNVQQVDMDRYYFDHQYQNYRENKQALDNEVYRVYKNSENLGTPRKPEQQP